MAERVFERRRAAKVKHGLESSSKGIAQKRKDMLGNGEAANRKEVLSNGIA